MGSSIFRWVTGATHPPANKYTEAAPAQQGGSLTAAIPARTGVTARIRMPFYLIPGDLLLLSPVYLVSPKTYEGMAVMRAWRSLRSMAD
jgi:hypothetical protein